MTSDYETAHPDEDHTFNPELQEALQILKSVVIQLPNANRDSLAFLFLHFRRVIDARVVTRMSTESMAKIFAPTIVGTQSTAPAFRASVSANGLEKMTAAALKINVKQISVMLALFRLPRSFWNGLLKDPNYCPLGKAIFILIDFLHV